MGPKTYMPSASSISRQWYVIDAAGKNLGRLASDIAYVLRGKHRPAYTPTLDMGDYVIVVNAEKIAVTGSKLEDKMYYRHSGYPGGFRALSMAHMLRTHPERVIEHAVRGMLPRTKLGDDMYRKMRVYAGPAHPHQGQLPQDLVEVIPTLRGQGRSGIESMRAH